MKNKIILGAFAALFLSAVVSVNADAAPWRSCYHHHYCGPRVAVRAWVPPVRVVAPVVRIAPPVPVVYGSGYYGGYYGHPRYYGRDGYYRHPHYYGHGYGHSYYGHRGGYYHRR